MIAQQKIWEPTPRQSDFLSLPDDIFEALYGGAAGGGKTDTLLSIPIVKKDKNDKPLYTNPRFKMLLLRRTFPELDSEVVLRSKGIGAFPPYTAFDFLPYQEKFKRWINKSGAVVQFGHCEHEKDVAKYDTSEYNVIAFDEATSFTPYQYEYLSFSRCRSSAPDLPAFVRAGTNPGNIAHSYFRDRFVKPCKTGNVVLRETRKVHGVEQTILRIFIPSKATDNKYLLLNDPGYLTRLSKLPPAERAAKLDGDWWIFSGQVFDDWRTEPLHGEPDNAKHVIEPFQIPEYWPKVLSIDWGYSANTVCGWYAINPLPSQRYPAKVYKYREYVCKKTKISVWASDVRRISAREAYADVVMCRSAWQERGDPSDIQTQFANEFGISPRKATNDRVAGKLLIQEYLRWSPRPARYVPQTGFDADLALRIRRMSGNRAYEEYCALFQPEEAESFLPKFQIFDTCEEIIKVLPICVYDKDKPEDVAEFDGDDAYDETRYGLNACQNYLDGGLIEAEQTDLRAKICSQYEQTKNINQFYMQMDRLDAKESKNKIGVKRFHSRKNLNARIYSR